MDGGTSLRTSGLGSLWLKGQKGGQLAPWPYLNLAGQLLEVLAEEEVPVLLEGVEEDTEVSLLGYVLKTICIKAHYIPFLMEVRNVFALFSLHCQFPVYLYEDGG